MPPMPYLQCLCNELVIKCRELHVYSHAHVHLLSMLGYINIYSFSVQILFFGVHIKCVTEFKT